MRLLNLYSTKPIYLLIAVTMSLTACAPVGEPLRKATVIPLEARTADSTLTGAATQVFNPLQGTQTLTNYTLAGNQRQINRLQQQIQPYKSNELSSSIAHVDVAFLDKMFNATNTPEILKVNLMLQGSFTDEIEFLGTLEKGSERRFQKSLGINTNPNSQYSYTLDALCENVECSNISLILGQYSGEAKSTQLIAKAGINFSLSTPTLEIEKSLDFGESSSDQSLQQLAQLDLSKVTPSKATVVILDGKSYSEVKIIDSRSLAPIVSFDTPLTETNETTTFISDQSGALSKNLSLELVGNDPSTGSLAVDISRWKKVSHPEISQSTQIGKPVNKDGPYSNQERAEGVRIYVVDNPVTVEPPKSSELLLLDNVNPGKVFPLPKGQTNLVKTNKVTQEIAKRYNPYKGELARVVRVIQGLEADKFCKNSSGKYTLTRGFNFPSRAQKFLNNSQNISPYLVKVFEQIDVTPKVGNILLVESNSMTKDLPQNLNILGRAGEVGPYQIMEATGKYIDQQLLNGQGMRISPVRSGKPDIGDDRQYLIPASKLAGTYMKQLFSQFKDPGMAVMSYNRGARNVNRDKRRAESRTEKFDNTLDRIVQYNMYSRDSKRCSALHYAYTFLAMYFISENPEEFGFSVDTSVKFRPETLKRILYNPVKKNN